MRTTRIALALTSLVVGLAASGAPAAAGGATTRYVDDDGRAGSTCGSETTAYRRVQSAIDASHAGDTVKVCPGSYRGHVVIGPSRDGLRLVAASDTRPTLRPIRTPDRYLIEVNRAQGVVIRGFRFLPHGGSGECTETGLIGISGEARVRVVDNVFSGIAPFETGCQRYHVAIGASRCCESGSGSNSVTIEDNVIRDFAVGIVSDLSFIRAIGNRFLIRGGGDLDTRLVVSAYGIRLVIRDNVVRVHPASTSDVTVVDADLSPGPSGTARITGNVFEGVSAGLVISFGGDVVIEDNAVLSRGAGTAASSGIDLFSDSALVRDNVVTGFRGSGIDATSYGGLIEDNDFRGNIGIDCRGSSSKTTWRRNLGTESKPAGLCSRHR